MKHRKTVIAILKATKEKLKGSWTQMVYARDEMGNPIDDLSSEACQWCLLGALDSVICFEDFPGKSNYPMPLVVSHLRSLIDPSDYDHDFDYDVPNPVADEELVASWNDEAGRTEEEVQVLLSKAIEEAESQR